MGRWGFNAKIINIGKIISIIGRMGRGGNCWEEHRIISIMVERKIILISGRLGRECKIISIAVRRMVICRRKT